MFRGYCSPFSVEMRLRCVLCVAFSVAWHLTSGNPTGAYQPPLLVPVSSTSALKNSYQPPIALSQQASPQSYSVVYTPPENPKRQSHSLLASHADHAKSLPTSYQQPNSLATSYSVHQQPPSVERTYLQGSSPSQAIHKAPASEIEPEKSSLAKDRDNKKEEYVVYYYYYYDNETSPRHSGNNNLSLSFDDIPSLESYDQDGRVEPEKNPNALTPENVSSQPRSVSGSVDRTPTEETFVQPLRPIPNVFRYGSNEVPRFPVLPNFVVSQGQPPTDATPPVALDVPSTTPETPMDLDNELNNNVLDPRPNDYQEPAQTSSSYTSTMTTTTETTTMTTTEAPQTDPTTTTERPRRRPPVGGGGRRRFNPSSSPSPRPSPSPSSTTSTRAPANGRFQGNRVRPRPSGGFGRSRTSSRTTEEDESLTSEVSSQSPPSSSSSSSSPSSTTARSRFTSQAPRRFQSSRSRSPSNGVSSTTSTTSTTRSPQRSRTTSRPRPSIISRNRPPRPGFPRSRPEPETTTRVTETTDAPDDVPTATLVEEDDDHDETVSEDEEEEEPSTENTPTTTEASRFSALFKPRNRANRPRPPLLGNRPPRV